MTQFNMGDLVYAAEDLFNDPVEETGESAIPGMEVGELLVTAGTRGVIVNVGHVEALPDEEIYLVRFEIDADGVLSEPLGCIAEELTYGAGAG
jgi:nitrogen fixation protein NifZ